MKEEGETHAESLFLILGFILERFPNCDGKCISTLNDSKTWLCDNQCQDFSTPCNGRCPNFYKLNCNNKCEEYLTYHLCNNECTSKEIQCNSVCTYDYVLCNEKCQSDSVQCNGKCFDGRIPNCDGKCIFGTLDKWMCNDNCISTSASCNGRCPEGDLKIKID